MVVRRPASGFSKPLVCRVGVRSRLGGGMDVVVVARLHGFNVSTFASRGVLNTDRRRAGGWDREQLIGGKPIEARK